MHCFIVRSAEQQQQAVSKHKNETPISTIDSIRSFLVFIAEKEANDRLWWYGALS